MTLGVLEFERFAVRHVETHAGPKGQSHWRYLV